jgi:hypothetical protein
MLMTVALSPALALDYLRELSADFRAGIVLDARGERLAGPEALLAPARALLDADPDAIEITGRTADGHAYAVRGARHTVVVATGPFALPRVVLHDLRTVLGALGPDAASPGRAAPAEGTTAAPIRPRGSAPEGLVRVLLAAAEDGFSRHSAI